jgi:hypothetical protein
MLCWSVSGIDRSGRPEITACAFSTGSVAHVARAHLMDVEARKAQAQAVAEFRVHLDGMKLPGRDATIQDRLRDVAGACPQLDNRAACGVEFGHHFRTEEA